MSFTQDTKERLCGEKIKNKCCRVSLLYGILLFGHRFDRDSILLKSENVHVLNLAKNISHEFTSSEGKIDFADEKNQTGGKFTLEKENFIFDLLNYGDSEKTRVIKEKIIYKCVCCPKYFLRGVFLSCGSVINPKTAYHLEFSVPDEHLAESFLELLLKYGLNAKMFKRKKDQVVYTKESEAVEDFLNFIGAQKSAFEVMNQKIEKAIRNDMNRIVNCETSNLDKAISAAQETIEAIKAIQAQGRFELLPDELKITGRLRFEHPEKSLSELVTLHPLPISKSGINHRLKKLIELSKK